MRRPILPASTPDRRTTGRLAIGTTVWPRGRHRVLSPVWVGEDICVWLEPVATNYLGVDPVVHRVYGESVVRDYSFGMDGAV